MLRGDTGRGIIPIPRANCKKPSNLLRVPGGFRLAIGQCRASGPTLMIVSDEVDEHAFDVVAEAAALRVEAPQVAADARKVRRSAP